MNVYFIGSFLPKDRVDEIRICSHNLISNANSLFQYNLIKGLEVYYPNLRSVTLPNIGAFPNRYNKIYFKGGESKRLNVLSFLNIPIIKHISRFFSLRHDFKKKPLEDSDIIFIYDFDIALFLFLITIKNKNVKVCLIVPDLPDMTGENSRLFSLFSYISNFIYKKGLNRVNAFSLITKNMINKLPIGNKKYTVLEGIYDEDIKLEQHYECDQKLKIIFYAGALNNRNNIMSLIKAFELIDNNNYRLYIYGDGELRNEIIRKAVDDSRIIYCGQVNHNEILLKQRESSLLINPRLPGDDFTKFSFPSKTMEYFASGVPTLMYRLEGVPEEYFTYCYVLDDDSIEILRDTIINICEKRNNYIDSLEEKAKEFILKNKTPLVQCNKIFEIM